MAGVSRRFSRTLIRPGWRAIVLLSYKLWGIEVINKLLLVAGKGRASDLLRRFGARIDRGDRILTPLIMHNAENNYEHLSIGKNCHVGRDVFLDLRKPIVIGDDVTVSMRVTILTHMDVGNTPLRHIYPLQEAEVSIGSGAYIGAGAILLSGTVIGECATVAAGAVVRGTVPPFSVVAGVPAKVVKRHARDPQSERQAVVELPVR